MSMSMSTAGNGTGYAGGDDSAFDYGLLSEKNNKVTYGDGSFLYDLLLVIGSCKYLALFLVAVYSLTRFAYTSISRRVSVSLFDPQMALLLIDGVILTVPFLSLLGIVHHNETTCKVILIPNQFLHAYHFLLSAAISMNLYLPGIPAMHRAQQATDDKAAVLGPGFAAGALSLWYLFYDLPDCKPPGVYTTLSVLDRVLLGLELCATYIAPLIATVVFRAIVSMRQMRQRPAIQHDEGADLEVLSNPDEAEVAQPRVTAPVRQLIWLVVLVCLNVLEVVHQFYFLFRHRIVYHVVIYFARIFYFAQFAFSVVSLSKELRARIEQRAAARQAIALDAIDIANP